MIKIQSVLLFIALLSLCLSQAIEIAPINVTPTENISTIITPTVNPLGPQYSDPAFLKLINNYFGCKIWTEGVCSQCSQGYVFNKNGICCEVDQHCKNFNRQVGVCNLCYQGYSVSGNGSCTVNSLLTDNNVGCAKWVNGVCSECSTMYHFNANSICVRVNDLCRTWDNAGVCLSCYLGYILENGICAHSPVFPGQQAANANPLCKKWNGDVCLQCADRAYFKPDGICYSVSDNCNTWDRLDGVCVSCYKGFDLVNGACDVSSANTAAPLDLGCKTWNGDICQQCSANWVFNPLKVCITVSSLCKTYDTNSDCLSCYYGYDIVNGSCLYSPSNNAKPTDSGCKTWSWKESKCTECSSNWNFDINGLCIPVNDQCRTSNTNNLCTSCYFGYDLVDGSCIYSVSNTASLPDAGCKIWDWNNNKCSQCSFFWSFNKDGVCSQLSAHCATFNHDSCTSCYRGYDLVNGSCIYSPSNTAAPIDPGCRRWEGSICLECSKNWAFNEIKVCTPVNDLCKTSDGLICTSCFNGYSLVNGSCLYNPHNAIPSDAGCKTWDWNNQICTECSHFWFFTDGKCIPVNDLCKSYDLTSGACTSCFKGYDLNNGACEVSIKNTGPSDLGCAEWNWDNQTCIACSRNWVAINGVCQKVSPLCNTYNNLTGLCTSCFSGYALADGNCSPAPISLCKTEDSNGCLSCYGGYALYQKRCISLSSLADIALYYAECCPEKLAQLQAEGRIPK